MSLLTIDPGVNGCAMAFWVDSVLIALDYTAYLPRSFSGADRVIVELPQIYTGSKGKGNPNNLVRLAFAAGRVVGGRPCETVLPRVWKGTIKKEAMLRRILRAMNDNELALLKACNLPKSTEHNLVDAIGIGLWYHKRL